jgi:hypothetical protein
MPTRTALVVCGVLIGAGCGAYFPPDRNIKDRLEESAVIGRWSLTDRSLALLKRDGFQPDPSRPYTVAIKPDHTCLFSSVLTASYRVVAPCTWLLEHDTRGDSNVQKANSLRLDLDGEGVKQRLYLNLARDRGRLLLWNFLGDPDLWEFIEYQQE